MFVKRVLLLTVLFVGAFAQEGVRELVSRENKVSNMNKDGQIKVVKDEDDVFALANRWATALMDSWKGGVKASPVILQEYAPDGALTMHSNKGGFATGSQLLATLEDVPLLTTAQKNVYFQNFLQGDPIPTLGDMQARLISKDVASLAGTWSFTFKSDRAKVVKARVTMIWKKYAKVPGSTKKNQWLIVEMHSSLLPNNTYFPSN